MILIPDDKITNEDTTIRNLGKYLILIKLNSTFMFILFFPNSLPNGLFSMPDNYPDMTSEYWII
ncbi:MAG TPA: hypothetical protein DSN98_02690 [Thermoplasmata archaeon]|jgi:hypothetical protein|nr:MAG TPA: hypothetical protein DSN98_02690 [Thermoplasmata archaeon]